MRTGTIAAMKIVAVTLALIIATVATTFLGLLTWDALSEEEEVTTDWLDYQACIETVTLEEVNEADLLNPEGVDSSVLSLVAEEPQFLPTLMLLGRAGATEACAELRPLLSTDE